MNVVILDRRKITGKITANMPLCVIEEIFDAHLMLYNHDYIYNPKYLKICLKHLNNSKFYSVDTTRLTMTDIKLICSYVNKDGNFENIGKLLCALKFLEKFYDLKDIIYLNNIFYGPQTNNKLTSLNSCVIYKLCSLLGMSMNFNVTFKNMVDFIDPYINPKIPEVPVIWDTIKDTLKNIISYCITVFGIDLSYANDPLKEYDFYVSRDFRNYVPRDFKMKKRLSLYPEKYWTSLFNPEIPVVIYNPMQLRNMAYFEGYESNEFTDPYEVLQLTYMEGTFFPGRFGEYNIFSLYGDDFSEIPNEELVSYGKYLEVKTLFKLSELEETFRYYRIFKNPSTNGVSFSIHSIKKLLNIYRDKNIDLSNIITKLIKEFFKLNNDLKLLLNSFVKEKKDIIGFFISLLHLGFYMRGWDGKNDYPLKCIPIDSPDKV